MSDPQSVYSTEDGVDVRRLRAKNEALAEELRLRIEEIARLHLAKFKTFGRHDCWMWQGDGGDKLESLVCPVVIWPKDLMAIIAERDLLRSCAVCGALLMPPSDPPHCCDCTPDDEHLHEWEAKTK